MSEKDHTLTTKNDNNLAPGDVVSGLESSEFVEIQRVAPFGGKTLVEGVGLQSRRMVRRPLAAEELAALVKVRGPQHTFDGDAELFLLGAEAERIRIAHQFDPLFAVNSSIVDPLPHQVEAVYRYLLPLPRIRFLLADDTGAGKTIMTGLLIKELLFRGVLQKVLIITRGGLAKQWKEEELEEKFGLHARLVNRASFDAEPGQFSRNEEGIFVISIDFLARNEDCLRAACDPQWDLVVVDEAHKLSAYEYGTKLEESERYKAVKALARKTDHLLFLTATPHRGRKDTFRRLLLLLDEDLFQKDKHVADRVREQAAPYGAPAEEEEFDGERPISKARNRFFLRRLKDGRPVVGYLWARTAPCSNPSCRGEIPLLRSLLVCNKKDKKVALTMQVDKAGKAVRFGIAEGTAITRTDGTKRERGPAICPFCDQPTSEADLRRAGQEGRMGERMVAVITEDKDGKHYRPVEETDLAAFREAAAIEVELPQELILPEVNAEDADDDVSNSTGIRVHLYGMKTWGSLFNPRQLVAMQTFIACLREALEAMKEEIQDEEYRKAVGVYLGLWLSRIAMFQASVGRLLPDLEAVTHPFNAARLPMTWDYPETIPFAEASGGAWGQIQWMLRVIQHESEGVTPAQVLVGDGARMALKGESVPATVTDPQYFDEAAYADLSDFFYVWLKRAIGEVVPEAMATPLTPKSDEATALKHRHAGDGAAADKHFTDKLAQVFAESKRVTKPNGVYSIVFAHQETQAWTALIRSLFAAGLTIDATWPIEMEMANRPRAQNSAALQTSITVVCRPRVLESAAAFKQVRREIEQVVQESIKRFWSYGFRGADLIVACYGPAVGVFGKYERVEKADGTPVGIPELLELAREAARDAIGGEFRGDNLSTLYYVWANLYGTAEQAWDDARLVVQIGGDEDNAMEVARGHGIFVVDGSKCRLALLEDRADRRGLGIDQNPPHIDALHRSMLLWKQEKRKELVGYLDERGLLEDGPFWKLAQPLFEVLPRDLEDWKLVTALLSERQTLRAEGKRASYRDGQATLLEGKTK